MVEDCNNKLDVDSTRQSNQKLLEDRIRQLETRLTRLQRYRSQQREEKRVRKPRSKSTETSNTKNLYLLNPNKGYFHQPIYSKIPPKKGQKRYSFNHPPEVAVELPNLVSQLETSQYFWDVPANEWNVKLFNERNMRLPYSTGSRLDYLLPLNNAIPDSMSGILFDSDLPAMEQKLNEIRENLAKLKTFGLNSSPINYLRHTNESAAFDKSNNYGIKNTNYKNIRLDNIESSFAEIQMRILNMEFHIERRLRYILQQKPLPNNTEINFHHNQKSLNATTTIMASALRNDTNNLEKNSNATPKITFKVNVDENERAVSNSQITNTVSELNNELNQNHTKIPTTSNRISLLPNNEALVSATITKPSENIFQLNKETTKNAIEDTIAVTNQQQTVSETEKPTIKPINTTNFDLGSRSWNINETNHGNINNTTQQNSKNYNRMLELLRRPHYDISTSSSSDDENFGVKTTNHQIQPTRATIPVSAGQQQLADGQQKQSQFMATNQAELLKKNSSIGLEKSIIKIPQEKDSDSDFFD